MGPSSAGRSALRSGWLLGLGCTREESAGDFLDRLLGEFLEELRAAGQVELVDQGGLESTITPGLTAPEVFSERLTGHMGQVGHGNSLDRSPGGVTDQRRLEDAGD